jgi:hypothetical protein
LAWGATTPMHWRNEQCSQWQRVYGGSRGDFRAVEASLHPQTLELMLLFGSTGLCSIITEFHLALMLNSEVILLRILGSEKSNYGKDSFAILSIFPLSLFLCSTGVWTQA